MLSTLASVITVAEELEQELAPLIAPAPVLGGIAALVQRAANALQHAQRRLTSSGRGADSRGESVAIDGAWGAPKNCGCDSAQLHHR